MEFHESFLDLRSTHSRQHIIYGVPLTSAISEILIGLNDDGESIRVSDEIYGFTILQTDGLLLGYCGILLGSFDHSTPNIRFWLDRLVPVDQSKLAINLIPTKEQHDLVCVMVANLLPQLKSRVLDIGIYLINTHNVNPRLGLQC